MGTPSVGDVVLVRFPFSDLSQSKLRPAVVLADAGRSDWVLCQVTSNAYGDAAAVLLASSDFAAGSLSTVSYARPGKLFTASESLMTSQAGRLNRATLGRGVGAVIGLPQPSA